MSSCVIVWFRKDLRVHDHQPLIRAAKSGRPVLGVYIFDPEEYQETAYGFPKTDRHRAQFIRESVDDLRNNLSDIGVPLLVRYEDPVDTFTSIQEEVDIESVFLHEEIGSEEQRVEERVRGSLPDTTFTVDHGRNLYHPDDLPFDIHDLPDTFSQFRKRIEKNNTMVRPSLTPPKDVQGASLSLDYGECPSLSALGLKELDREPRYRGGSSNAKERLLDYIFHKDRLKHYKETRNGMLKEDDSSKFSPWLAHGCLSAKVVYEQILKYEQESVKNRSTYMLYFELLWRDYFHLVHRKHGNRIFFPSGLRDQDVPWNDNQEHAVAWREGRTGYPLVDAAMRELKETGFTSNRARQNVASFFTKNLGLDWREGAAWFESQLVDHDVASNYGNWLYIAGVGNDAVQFRAFNVEKQAQDYDPEGAYLRHWLPELRDVPVPWIFKPREMGMVEQEQFGVMLGEDYPLPIVDLLSAMQERKAVFLEAMNK
ncbi:DASH family cryptochrome [Halobacillus litoralis]|uniref:DASH family cryptochrome n=1 Tax=Halobacillus litoralis TaxID=45668 RepID=UPI001CD6D9A1|nr:DASH family cryptochrome [Halobacillus litoralis]MCA0972273.1 DASH family cryptochrome [Halobacillus litoralis]